MWIDYVYACELLNELFISQELQNISSAWNFEFMREQWI
jgi:hypothetical protein